MPDAALRTVVHYLRHMTSPGGNCALNDAQLLGRFTQNRDEAAFEVLVWRHGGLVLGVCRNLLRNEQDAEDAFQATFFALARRPPALANDASLAGWIHKVSYRIALRILAQSRRHRTSEYQDAALAAQPQQATEATIEQSELWGMVIEELHRLPDSYRRPIISCFLEGKTQEQAARELHRPLGSMSRMLGRGCEMLSHRLTRRGVALSASLVSATIADSARATLLPTTVVPTVTAALQFSAGMAVSGRAPQFANWALTSMLLSKFKIPAGVLLGLFVLVAGTAGLAHQARTIASDSQPAIESQDQTVPTSAKSRTQVNLDDDPLPPGAIARIGTTRFHHGLTIMDITYSPDGKIVAAIDPNRASLWEVATGKELLRLPGNVWGGIAFAPDNKSLLTADVRDLIRWELPSGRQLQRIPCAEQIRSVAYAPNGKTIAWLTVMNDLRLSDAATGEVLHRWPGPANYMVSSFAFSPDSRLLAFACQNENDIPIFDTKTGEQALRLIGHTQNVHTVTFSPDGKTAASSAQDGTVRLWDITTGKELLQVPQNDGVWKLAFSPDGALLATGAWNLRTWNAKTGDLIRKFERDDTGDVRSLAFSPDGKELLSCRSDSHVIHFWDVSTGKKRRAATGHQGSLASLAISPDGRLLASTSRERHETLNPVHLWAAATGKEVGSVDAYIDFFSGLAFSPDGRLLAAGNQDGTIRLWDPASRREIRKLEGHKDVVEWIGFSADSKTLISLGCRDRRIYRWDLSTGEKLSQFSSLSATGNGGIALSSDGKFIAQGGTKNTPLVLTDTATGKTVRQFGASIPASTLALSPDSRILATAGDDDICLWDVESGKELGRLTDAGGRKGFLTFSPDSRILASGGNDGFVRFWELASGKERCRLEGHRGPVRCGTFSPDSRRFFSGSEDTTVLIWDLTARHPDGGSAKLSSRQLAELLADLAAADAGRANGAIGTLIAAPDQSVPALQARLKPATAPAPERVKKQIAELDSNDFTRREQATREIRTMGDVVIPTLRKELANRPSLEMRRRLEQLLVELRHLSGGQLFELRAVEILERIGTQEARQVLESLARGVPEAQLTRDAKASLTRLTQGTLSMH